MKLLLLKMYKKLSQIPKLTEKLLDVCESDVIQREDGVSFLPRNLSKRFDPNFSGILSSSTSLFNFSLGRAFSTLPLTSLLDLWGRLLQRFENSNSVDDISAPAIETFCVFLCNIQVAPDFT